MANIHDDLKKYYNESEKYISVMQTHDAYYFSTYLNLIKSNLKYLPQKRGKLLELGCGGGQSTNYLANNLTEFKCIGTDISKKAIDAARKNYVSKNLDFEVIDALSLPYSDEEFEIVSSCDVIEHLPNTQKALDEMIRVLEPNGLLILKAPHHLNPILPLVDFLKLRNRYPFTKKWLQNIPRFISLSLNFVKNLISKKVNFKTRVPDLTNSVQVGNDADAVYEVSVIDLVKYLKQSGLELKNIAQPRHNSFTSWLYTKLFPYFSSIGIVAQKISK